MKIINSMLLFVLLLLLNGCVTKSHFSNTQTKDYDTRTKKIFISDIHMGTEDSVTNKYGWFWSEKAIELGKFLTQLANDETVSELVILGDLFDEWVVPYDTSPLTAGINQFEIIANASHNQPVINGLKKLIATPGITVSYVPGNHDMLIQSGQLTKILPGIKAIIDPTVTGKGVYKSNHVYAEHGSYYDIFNAPDTYNKLQGATHHIPVGFFLARSQAQSVIDGNPLSKLSLFKQIEGIWKNWDKKDPLITNFYDGVASLSNTKGKTIVMNGIDGINNNVLNAIDVTNTYGNTYDQWDKNMPDSVDATVSVIGAIGMLRPAALLQYHSLVHNNIVLFGHTHTAEIKSGWLPKSDESTKILKTARDANHPTKKEALDKLLNLPEVNESGASGFIYVNTGTWISGDGGKPDATQRANYVVIEQNGTRTYASLYNYNGELYSTSSQIGKTYHTDN